MKRAAAACVLVGALMAGGSAAAAGDSEAAAADVAVAVVTADVRAATVVRSFSAFGSVEADPAATDVVALPRAGVIRRVLVRAGERVEAGTGLLEVDTAPGPRMQYAQAQAALRYAETQVAATQRLFDGQLATREQLAQAQRDLADAQANEHALRAVGADAQRAVLRAPRAGVVTQLLVSTGDRTVADAAALNLSADDALIVRLGIAPELAREISAGAHVSLVGVFDATLVVESAVTQVQGMVNPATQLLDVIVAVPKDRAAALPLGTQMRASIAAGTVDALLVPRSAVLRDETGDHVFVIAAAHAQRRSVQMLQDEGAQIALAGSLNAGDVVAVAGNYQLSDGVAVTASRGDE